MIGTIARVVRGEGVVSAFRRAGERIGEDVRARTKLLRGAFARAPRPELVNVAGTRYGGVMVQLNARLSEERTLRTVARYDRGVLEIGARAWRVDSLEARALVVEGAFDGLPPLPDVDRVYVIHDFSLISGNPQELEIVEARRHAAERLLGQARAAIFPSAFLRDAYRSVIPRVEAHVIEPGIAEAAVRARPIRNRIAFAGDVRPHKGGALLGEIIRTTPDAEWHVFGGGEVALLRALRAMPNVTVHGYYRAGTLPRLLARHRIGLAVLPSRFLETFSLTLSECWSAGVPVVSFDRSAIAERIRAHGGGLLVPYESGAEGIAAGVRELLRGDAVDVPARVPTAREAAAAHVALYRELGLI